MSPVDTDCSTQGRNTRQRFIETCQLSSNEVNFSHKPQSIRQLRLQIGLGTEKTTSCLIVLDNRKIRFFIRLAGKTGVNEIPHVVNVKTAVQLYPVAAVAEREINAVALLRSEIRIADVKDLDSRMRAIVI